MTQELEFRVLSGAHRHARCPARNGAVLGAESTCDIVLTDDDLAPRTARLHIGSTGWNVVVCDAILDPVPELEFNRPELLGSIWLTVARPNDPWVEILLPHDAATDADDGGLASVDAFTPAKAGPPLPPSNILGARDHFPQGATRGKHDPWPVILGLGTVVLALVVGVAAALLPSEFPETTRQDPRLAAAEKSLAHISAALENLELATPLRVALSSDGNATVTGWVRDNAEQDRVAATLSGIWPMPVMHVCNGEDAVRQATALLEKFGVKYGPQYQGDGKLLVMGIAPSAQERAAVIQKLRSHLAQIPALEDCIMLAPQVSNALASQLADAGLSNVSLTWKPDHLEIQAHDLNGDEQLRLRAITAEFNKTHLDVATLKQHSPDMRDAASSVPFDIRSVVGGPQPCIVLGNGTKLLVGGKYLQYRLKAIEDKRIVFDGPHPAVVPR